jgi:flavin reductase (DIM6/NTAB) family NADH-FMN oxidoreductase RutF
METAPIQEVDELWRTPQRVVLVVSVDGEGRPNIATVAWKMRTSEEPPLLAISLGKASLSHQLLMEGREFVLAVPSEHIWREALYCGTHSGRDVDKLEETGLIPLPARYIAPPLIQQCIANYECRVVDHLDTGDSTLFVGQVLAAWRRAEDERNLLLVGWERGCVYLGGAEEGYRLGVVKR